MPSQYVYQHAQGSNVDLSAQVRAYRTEASMNAEEGSVAISTFYVDDELGGLDIIGHHKFFWRETSEASNNKTILYALVADRDISRGPFKVINSRQWAVNVADVNSLLGRGIMRGADANRPAETDVQRIQWLMTTGEMVLILDSTYISTSGGIAMDAADYRDQTVLSIIDDAAQASGKNYWVIVMNEDPNPRLGLFYDFASSTAYTSTVRLTNVLADVDSSTTFAVFNDDLKLNRDPSRVFSSVLLPFDGGEVFDTNDTTRINFGRRDTTAPSINVKSTAKAHARAQRYLTDIATEEDRLTMSYLVPLAKVNRLMHGHRFQVKFSHLPGYEDWTYVRAVKRTVKAESEEFYRVTIEATRAQGTVATCSTSQSGAIVTTSGIIHDTTGPTTVNPTTPGSPSLLIGGWFDTEGTGLVLGTPAIAAPWTEMDRAADAGTHTVALSAYRAFSSGTPEAFTVSGFSGSGGNPSARGFTVSFATSASAPVQWKKASGSTTVTFDAATTPGNLVVILWFAEGASGPTPDPPVYDASHPWTKLVRYDDSGGNIGIGGFSSGIYCVCISTGATTYNTGSAAFAHWVLAVEVPIV